MIKIAMPEQVENILKTLHKAGFEAYAVGGCVRDCIMGADPEDWDITTSAFPEEVKALFKRTIDTGLQHGTVTVMINKTAYEITTFRVDGFYEDFRRPTGVSFTGDLVEDLKRRDFTMNAMAYNEIEGLIDVFGGRQDIEDKIIRCVGVAEERFQEDALRMLRAIRFSAKLGFKMSEDTKRGIRLKAPLINNISGERINMEMTKILTSENPHYVEYLVKLGLMEYIIPEFMKNVGIDQKNRHHIYSIDRHIYKSLKYIEPIAKLRWAMFLHDIGKGYCFTIDQNGVGHFYGHEKISVDLSAKILNRLKFDNNTKADIIKLIHYHDYRMEPEIKQVRKAVHIIGQELFEDFLKVQKADVLSQNPAYYDENLGKLEKIRECFAEIIRKNQCTTIKQLEINGFDLIELGIAQGKKIGEILGTLLELVIEEPEKNTRQWLLEKAKLLAAYTEAENSDKI